MSEGEQIGEAEGDPSGLATADAVGEDGEELSAEFLWGEDAEKGEAPPSRGAGVNRKKISLVVAALVSVIVCAAIVPIISPPDSALSAAASNVFDQPTVQFALSVSGAKVGTLGDYSLVLTMSNPTGGAVSDPGADNSVELSVMHQSTDLADLLEGDGGIYLRVNTPAIDQLVSQNDASSGTSDSGQTLSQYLQKGSDRPGLGWLATVANGGWIGIKTSEITSWVKTHAPSKVQQYAKPENYQSIRSAFTLSFAQAWDAWTSTKTIGTTDGVTQYSVNLPVQKFVGSLATSLFSKLSASFPELKITPAEIQHSVDQIPADLSIPIQMWSANGSLIKVAATYKAVTVTAAISHPAPLTAPSGATMLTIANLRDFGRWTSEQASAGSAGLVAELNLETAMTAADTYYTNSNQTYAGMTDRSNPQSVYAIDAGMQFLTDQPSTGPNAVSMHLLSGGQGVLLVNWSRATRSCFGILDLRAAQPAVVDGISSRAGTYFFELKHVARSSCDAGTIANVPKFSTHGFPSQGSGVSGGPLLGIPGVAGGGVVGGSVGGSISVGPGGTISGLSGMSGMASAS